MKFQDSDRYLGDPVGALQPRTVGIASVCTGGGCEVSFGGESGPQRCCHQGYGYLTPALQGAVLIRPRVCPFPWWPSSHLGQFQANVVTARVPELGRDARDQLF